jgi:cation diffusion facilitator family transporter
MADKWSAATMQDDLSPWHKPHNFLADNHAKNMRRTQAVLALTLVTMVAEIIAGTVFGSMALLADGWHMGSHAAAMGIAVFAYIYARRHANSGVYTFGTGKVGDLAGFTSAIFLAVVAGLMIVESLERLANPINIAFDEALIVAVLGLIVNLASAWLLKDGHHHHGTDHAHDHNLRAAYVHVLTDALTSVLAILALLAGRFWGTAWMDPAMGLVGAVIILRWAWGLIASTSKVLLDAEPTGNLSNAVREVIEEDADNRVADLHVWRVGPGHLAAMITIVTEQPQPPSHYKDLLGDFTILSHVTVEIERKGNVTAT